jgi:phosphopantetheinyl transferase
LTVNVAVVKSAEILARVFDASCFLFPEEAIRLKSYSHTQAAMNFVAGRVLVRSLLYKLTGRPLSEMRFHVGPMRKPTLADLPAWHFNLSHKRQWVAVAVADRPVGVDIETAEGVEWRRVARRTFQPHEAERLVALPDQEGQLAFCRSWSYKEALIKVLAQHLDPLPELATNQSCASPWWAAGAPHQHIFLSTLVAPEGAGHVAVTAPCPRAAPHMLSLEDVVG